MSRLKTIIDANIKENGNQEITGKTMNYVLTEIANDVNTDGYFPNMSVGFADNLVGRGESVPAEFTFRATGGKSIKDGAARIKRIKGNSVVWNQLVDTIAPQDCELSENGNLLYITPHGFFPGVTNTTRVNLVKNHVYICISHRIGGGSLNINCGGYDGTSNAPFRVETRLEYGFSIYTYNETQPFTITRPIIVDLTQMFGAGNEPSTIEEYNARKPIVADEYAFNEGEVIHMNTESIKSVGDNAVSFGGEVLMPPESEPDKVKNYQEGYTYSGISASGYALAERVTKCEVYDGKVIVAATHGYGVGSFLEVLPNAEYHINASIEGNGDIYIAWYDAKKRWIRQEWSHNGVSPLNARYAMYCLIPNDSEVVFSDIMLTLVHSGWKQDTDAGYQPYWQDTLPLPIIRKYFPQGMKSAGSAHDEIRFNKASGKWEKVQRIGSVDLGSLEWDVTSNNRMIATSLENVIVRKDAANDTLLCAKYTNAYPSEVYLNTSDCIICSTNVGHIFVYDSAYTDAATFKAAMQGVILYYESADPIITEIDEPFGTDYRVADFGTEQAISSVPSAPFSADIIYQFNAVDMIRELWLKVQELESRVAQL